MLLCATCAAPPSFAGPLCLEPLRWDASRTQLVCKGCVLRRAAFMAEMLVMQQDQKDRADHIAECSFCHARRGLMPPLALSIACGLARKDREAASRKAVA